MERVSVVIPTFNRAVSVFAAVESALSQTHKALEVLVVDDGSTDGTADSFRTERPGVKYLRIPHSGLPAVARNAGIRAARGEFVALLDSDDEWSPAHLQTQLEHFRDNASAGLVCSNALIASSKKPFFQCFRSGKKHFSELARENFVVLSSVVARRQAVEAAGGFNEAPHLRAYEDYELWLRMALKSAICYSSEPSVIYSDLSSDSVRGAVDSDRDCLKLLQVFLSVLKAADTFKSPERENASQALISAHERLIYSRGAKSLRLRFISKIQLFSLKMLPEEIRIRMIRYRYA